MDMKNISNLKIPGTNIIIDEDSAIKEHREKYNLETGTLKESLSENAYQWARQTSKPSFDDFPRIRYECRTCGTLIILRNDQSISDSKCCKNPNFVLLSREYSNEDIETARLKLADCYEQMIYAHDHYLDWTIEEIKLQVMWDIATYFYNCFPAFPYRFVNAMKGSGKSRLLKLTESICWNGKLTAGMTDSALFRSAQASTLIFDEAESITSKDKKSQRLILNAGYKRGASIQVSKEKKVDGAKTFVTEDYPVYGPKMLANINGMEEVLGSRCISSILEKSANPAKVRLMEDFDTNPFFLNIKRTLTHVSVVLCSVVTGKNVLEKWDSYITKKYITTPTTLTTLNYTKLHDTTITEEELELFNKIDHFELDGRHLELFFPLFIVAQLIGQEVLEDILKIAGGKVKDRKESDLLESKDIALIDFVAKQDTSRSISYTPISELTQEFKHFFENDEDNFDWLNSRWLGRGLVRLNLITNKKRVSKGMEVVLDIVKAKEKLKIFKTEEVAE